MASSIPFTFPSVSSFQSHLIVLHYKDSVKAEHLLVHIVSLLSSRNISRHKFVTFISHEQLEELFNLRKFLVYGPFVGTLISPVEDKFDFCLFIFTFISRPNMALSSLSGALLSFEGARRSEKWHVEGVHLWRESVIT